MMPCNRQPGHAHIWRAAAKGAGRELYGRYLQICLRSVFQDFAEENGCPGLLGTGAKRCRTGGPAAKFFGQGGERRQAETALGMGAFRPETVGAPGGAPTKSISGIWQSMF